MRLRQVDDLQDLAGRADAFVDSGAHAVQS
jgi:hypothetical protein